MGRGFRLNLVSKVIFLIILLPVLAFAKRGTVAGSLIQDVELRSQYNIDDNDYSSALRIKLGTLNSGAKIELLEMQADGERAKLLFLTSSEKLQQALSAEKTEVSKRWSKSLRRAYNAYQEYLKSHPSAARSSVDIDVNEILVNSEVSIVESGKLNSKDLAGLSVDMNLLSKKIQDNQSKGLTLTKKSHSSDRSLIKFLEIGYKGSYEQSNDHDTVAKVGISLPLGFMGERFESRKKMALAKYKIKTEESQRKLRVNKVYSEFKFKKKLYFRLQSKLKTRKKIRRMTSSTSIRAEDKIKIYLDAVKISYKVLELKYEVADLYNEMLFLTAVADQGKFITIE